MPFKFYKLWEKMWDLNMTKDALSKQINVSPNTLTKMSRNKNVSLEVIDKICEYLDCEPNDIMEYVKKTPRK